MCTGAITVGVSAGADATDGGDANGGVGDADSISAIGWGLMGNTSRSW